MFPRSENITGLDVLRAVGTSEGVVKSWLKRKRAQPRYPDPIGTPASNIGDELSQDYPKSYWMDRQGVSTRVTAHWDSIKGFINQYIPNGSAMVKMGTYARAKGLVRLSGSKQILGIDTFGALSSSQHSIISSLFYRNPGMKLAWADYSPVLGEYLATGSTWESFFKYYKTAA